MITSDSLSIIVSVFNEENVLDKFYTTFKGIKERFTWDYEIIFVNDGSYDNSYDISGEANISGVASAGTTTAGYASTSTAASGSVSGVATVNATIPAAAATVVLKGTASNPTIAIDSANDNILASTATTTKPSSGYYAAVKATAPATTLTPTTTASFAYSCNIS